MAYKILPTVILTVALSGCVSKSWHVSQLKDEFTNAQSCRVERTSPENRDFIKAMAGVYYSYGFYAEKYNGVVRAGIRTEPSTLPIAGDVQIKVDEKLVTLTLADTPLDVAPETPQYQINKEAEKTLGAGFSKSMTEMTNNIKRMGSPYRALTGQKAINLLRDIANAKEEVKFRVVGVNSALSATGVISTGPEFAKALNECGIDIN